MHPAISGRLLRIGFWIKRALLVFGVAFLVLLGVELLKGHGLEAGARFALLWSAIATAVFIGTRIFYVSRGRNCPMCSDLPQAPSAQPPASGPPQ